MTKKPCVIIGVTGGIAAYKICTLVSSLRKQDYEVHVLMTNEAMQFVTPLTFQTLSNQKVITDMFTTDYTPEVHHVSLAKKADLFVIAPATANTIAKISCGLADNMLTATFLAAKCPKLIVPAMNVGMYENPITQENLRRCKSYGMEVLEPNSGYLACGDSGKGRMAEPQEIEDKIEQLLCRDYFLDGKHVVITAGPTRESLDPVRYLTNHSSGKMGYALAKTARNHGAKVTLVSGPTDLKPIAGVQTIAIESAQEMADAVLPLQDSADIMILAAAVADYTPLETAADKIHKADGDMSIPLKRTVDILETLGKRKREGQILVGFCMETKDLLESAQGKLTRKNCDYIVANNVKEQGAGFGTDTNKVTILSEQTRKELPLLTKEETAECILKTICGVREQ